MSADVDLQIPLFKELQATKLASKVGNLIEMRVALVKPKSAVARVALVAARVWANKAFVAIVIHSLFIIHAD